eukprot:UC1_evm1s819
MLLGSLPVIFLIIPCVLAGGFLLKVSEGGVWGSLSSMVLAIAALTQMMAMLAAGYYIEKVSAERQEELEAKPKDQEVAAADEKVKHRARLYRARTDWYTGGVPRTMKAVLVSAALTMTACTYLLVAFASSCFLPFQVTDTVDGALGGSTLNIVKSPLGWLAIGLCCGSFALAMVFKTWAKYHLKHTPKDYVAPEPIKEIEFVDTDTAISSSSSSNSNSNN